MEEKPTTAIVLSLISGILILVWSFWLIRVLIWRGMDGMMGVTASNLGGRLGFTPAMALIELISGGLVTLAAIMLAREPEKHKMYGVIILTFSAISLIGAPLGLGSIIGAVGGILAITWKPKR